MKILILVESLEVNRTSSGIVSSNFINALSKDNEIDIIHSEKAYENFPWLKNIGICRCVDFTGQSRVEKFINLFPKIRAIPTYFTGYHMGFNRLVKDWKHAIRKLLDEYQYNIIIVLGTGSSFAPHFAMAEMNLDVPWIANVHDPYPMSHYPEPYRKKDIFFYQNQTKRIDRVFQKATWVTFPSLYLVDWMSQYHSILKNKSFVLPHPEVSLFDLPESPEDQNVFLEKGKFNLLHAGSLLGPRDPKFLIKAYLRFIAEDGERKEKSVLNIIGKVAREHTGFEKEYGAVANNVNIVITRVSYKHSLKLLAQADVLILLEAVAKESPFMPGKLADYISVNKPIISLTPKTSETSRLLGNSYPYMTQTDNEDEIYTILVKLWEQWKNKNLDALNRDDLREYISSENINKILMEHINVHHS